MQRSVSPFQVRRTSSALTSSMRVAVVIALASCAVVGSRAAAQAAVPLPYTITTLAGSAPMSSATGTQCPNLPSGVKSVDAFGDGCLAVNAVFGSQARGGVQVDAFGNVFVADDVSSIIHVIDPNSGIMNVLAGGAPAVCAAAPSASAPGAVDASGDGCLAATQTRTPSTRGIGIDPFGNVLLAGYGDNAIHIVCRTASPNCTPAQIGTMQLVAGCVKSPGSAPSAGVGLDNVKAAQTFVTAGCTTANGELSSPRGAAGDVYGNIYFADTSSSRTRVVLGPQTSPFFSGTNPLYAALGVVYPSLTAGYAYSVVNLTGTGTTTGGTATIKGTSCSAATNGTTVVGTALDTFGDGCPFNASSVAASSGFTSGVAVDAAGNMVFPDPTHGLRVLFVSGSGNAGTQMSAAITANNAGVTPQPGFIYMLWGGGTTALGSAPTLGTATAATDSTITKVAVSPQGNIYIGDNNRVVSFDVTTGYVRQLFLGTANVATGSFCAGSAGLKSLSAFSDGCPAADSLFANGSGLGLSLDPANNLYLFDASSTSKMLVRKVLAQGLTPEILNTPQLQSFELHVPASGAGTLTATASLSPTFDDAVSATTCGSQNADGSFDCFATVTSTPTAAGPRSATLAFNTSLSGAAATTTTLALSTVVYGSVLAFDSGAITIAGTSTPLAPTTSSVFTGITPAVVAVDGSGNVFTIDTRSNHILESTSAGTFTLPGTLPSNPTQLAIDPTGNLYVLGSGNIVEFAVTGAATTPGQPLTYTASTIAYASIAGTPAPQALAVDPVGNLYIADKQGSAAATAIYRLPAARNSVQSQLVIATGFSNPVALTVDPTGDVYVADQGAATVYKLTPGLVNGTPSYVQSTVAGLSGLPAVALTTDPAGDLYLQGQGSGSIVEVPVTGPLTTIYTGIHNPSGIAVDGQGTVYSADLSSSSITSIQRDASSFNFGTNQAQTLTGTISDVGNQSTTGQNPVTNTSNFAVIGGATSGCSTTSNVLGPQSAGNACTLSANFVGAGTGTVSDQITFLPAATTLGSFTLTGSLQGTAVATTTTITDQTPSNPSFINGNTEVSFTVTVAAASGTPGGTVAVTVDGHTTNVQLSNGIAVVPLSGLSAGPHTIYAAYATSGSYTASNSGAPLSFTIVQDSVSLAWTPATSTLPYSAPLGTAVLNATATYNGAPVAGTFVYTANGREVHAASYLAVGSYTLAATFYPADATDFAAGSLTNRALMITQAPTNAALAATQMLVAADGTGNFNTVQSAINALPTNGGNVYLKPGTYTGFVTVANPNVSIYGLGGDPSKVVLTNEEGAFSPPFLPGQGYGNNGSAGDQGSATVVVARGTVNGNTGTPSNFYAEDLTIANTYDTSTTTSSTNALVGGTCTPNQPAQTLAALYNAGTECNSQALAIWITSDQAVLNNVYTTSQQDTIYAGSISASGPYAARQYWFRGKVTGDVDYIFGDAAAVFDHTSIYTTFHGSATGTETIEAQNKATQTGATPDYLSGYVMNSDVFTSQAAGMTNLYLGRPYGKYSTWVMLNSFIDQVNPLGYTEFQGDINLPTSTYAEYNDLPYTDPATNMPDLNGVPYLGTGGSSGAGITGTRETTSQDPGTPEAANQIKTSLTQPQAQGYYPLAFLSQTVPLSPYNSVTNWDPTVAIAIGANHFAATNAAATTIASGASITILMRPQTPGLGAVSNGVYTVPTGNYTLTDSLNSTSSTLASGTLDAAGEASLTTSSLSPGTHTLQWTYGGDANFAPSGSSAYTVTVTPPPGPAQLVSTTALTRQADGTYQAVVTVSNSGGSAAGNVTLTNLVLGASQASPTPQTLGSIAPSASAAATFTVPATAGTSGSHVLEKVSGTYTGGSFGGSLRTTLP